MAERINSNYKTFSGLTLEEITDDYKMSEQRYAVKNPDDFFEELLDLE
jgi:hypothetical protein